MTRHEAVWNWLYKCPHIHDLFFNYAQTNDSDDTQLIPSEENVLDYLDGSKLMRYNVALVRYMAISADPNDMQNITDLIDFEKLSDWVDEQNRSGNFPAFDNAIVNDITVLPNQAGFVVAQDMSYAKYQMQFKIEYIKR